MSSCVKKREKCLPMISSLLYCFARSAPGFHGRDVPLRVEKIDGIVPHSVEQRAKLQILAPREFLGFVLLGYIANDAQHNRAFWRSQGLEHDIDRELRTILAEREKVQGRTHLAGSRMSVVVLAMCRVARSESFRHEALDRLANQLRLAVSQRVLRRAGWLHE